VLVGFLLYLRRDAIIAGRAQPFDLGLLGITAALILIPFFSELTLLGVTLKQQVEDTKKELKQDLRESITAIRTDLQNAVSVNNRVSPQFFMNTPPPDEMLNQLKDQIKSSLLEINKDLGLRINQEPLRNLMPTEDAMLAFSSRYQLETELRRIWQESFAQEAPRTTGRALIRELIQAGVLPSSVGQSIEEVFSVSTPAIHGEQPTEKQIGFLKEVAPPLVATLRAMKVASPVSTNGLSSRYFKKP
jgi:uncharacterized protein (DUF2267 family)